MNAITIQSQGALGMMLAGFGALSVLQEAERNFLVGLSTAVGSAVMLSSFYQAHKFKKLDGKYNYLNIAMNAFMTLSLIGLNAMYAMGPHKQLDFCHTYPNNSVCKINS